MKHYKTPPSSSLHGLISKAVKGLEQFCVSIVPVPEGISLNKMLKFFVILFLSAVLEPVGLALWSKGCRFLTFTFFNLVYPDSVGESTGSTGISQTFLEKTIFNIWSTSNFQAQTHFQILKIQKGFLIRWGFLKIEI